MIPLLLIVVPLLLAAATRAGLARRAVPWLLVIAGVVEVALALALAVSADASRHLGGYLVIDATARLFLVVIHLVFLGIAVYVRNRVRSTPELEHGIERFAGLALLFLAAATFSVMSNHLLGTWVSLEITTLAAAPLVVRAGVASSRRASWRYFLFSSVGLGIALLGFLCLARGHEEAGQTATFFLDEIAALPPLPPGIWEKLGLSLAILGLGTKLGLAPMYSWLPETYDEAPPSVTALLAAVQFNCALVGLLRVLHLHRAGNESLVAGELLVLGLASMAVSTVSIISTRNIKRLLAYASINHAGVIAIGLGVGKATSYAVILYVVSNAFIKAILFLTAGKIKARYRTKDTREIAGLIKDLPYSGLFLMVGTFALLGFPPFGSFLGELMILSGLVQTGQILVFATFCLLITATFIATGRTIFPMIWGEPKRKVSWPRQTLPAAAPKLFFLIALVIMGLYMPPAINGLFRQVAASLEGQ